jgi:hypothetical protein
MKRNAALCYTPYLLHIIEAYLPQIMMWSAR